MKDRSVCFGNNTVRKLTFLDRIKESKENSSSWSLIALHYIAISGISLLVQRK